MAKKKTSKVRLTSSRLDYTIQDVRQVIVDRMKELDMTAYRLAKLSGVTLQTVSKFVDGTYDMKTERAARLLAALGLEIRAKR